MVTKDDVKKLAALARISVDEAELAAFTSEFDGILSYVGQLENAPAKPGQDEKPALRNIMREDAAARPAGTYTEKIAAQFPKRKGDALSVKQIIQHD
ncbi:MAG TPA: Asp-tRNA(Asn)/Glu-tRNA(Gln) amidotransferase subunit GatC [Candidatus Paceibacterota bacterium]|nr:Asp-tRNA(Asn)/Glu-tRNA(Gln) amidotransferase subunit GatC [Candidatus Paceibacterota bacterium]